MGFTALPIGGIFPVLGVYNTFNDYTELNIYPIENWAKFCDGSIVNDVDSPLNGQYVPDLTNAVLVGTNSAGQYLGKRKVASGIFSSEIMQTKDITSTENTITVKFFMRIK
jgi:hypothetical protein